MADGGTGASTATSARNNLGIGLMGTPFIFDGSATSPGTPASGHCAFNTGSLELLFHAVDSLGNNWSDVYAWGVQNFVVQMVDGNGHIAGGLALGFNNISGSNWNIAFDTDPTAMLAPFSSGQPIYLRY